jgi:hypothetical protein
MSDLSEQQVMLADAMAGGKAEKEDIHQKKVRNRWIRCSERFPRRIGFC